MILKLASPSFGHVIFSVLADDTPTWILCPHFRHHLMYLAFKKTEALKNKQTNKTENSIYTLITDCNR